MGRVLFGHRVGLHCGGRKDEAPERGPARQGEEDAARGEVHEDRHRQDPAVVEELGFYAWNKAICLYSVHEEDTASQRIGGAGSGWGLDRGCGLREG